MTNPLAETSPSTRGRILAALYLFVITAEAPGAGESWAIIKRELAKKLR